MNNLEEGYRSGLLRAGVIVLLCLAVCLHSPEKAFGARNFENEKEAFAFLINEMKCNPAAASGIMANLYAESNFSPTVWGGGVSYGICQWLGSRRTSLISFCSARGLDYSTMAGQLRFLEYELDTIYPSTYSKIKNVSNDEEGAYQAAYTFCYEFERPSNKSYRSAQRGDFAQNIFWPEYGALTATLTAEVTGDGIVLTWETLTDKRYLIFRCESEDGDYERIGKASDSGSGQYTDTSAQKGVTYYYQLRSAQDAQDDSFWSNKVSVKRSRSLGDTECDISLTRTEFTYSGKEKKPRVRVVYAGESLEKNKDYTVSYERNVKAGKKALVRITGMGDYSGEVQIRFLIRKAEQKLSTQPLAIPLSGKAEAVEAGQMGEITLQSSNKKVLKVKGQKLKALGFGTASITISAKATRNYKSAKAVVEAVVVPPSPVICSAQIVSARDDTISVRLKWKAKKSPNGFELQYTKALTFEKRAQTVQIRKGSKRTLKLRDLEAGKDWIFRIRTVKIVRGKKLYSQWSEIMGLGDT